MSSCSERDDAEKSRKELAVIQKQLVQSQHRIQEIDKVIRRLVYEDNVLEKLTDERFMTLSQGYEQEPREPKSKVTSTTAEITQQKEKSENVERFLQQVRKYTNVTELDSTMLNELIQRIEIHARDKIRLNKLIFALAMSAALASRI